MPSKITTTAVSLIVLLTLTACSAPAGSPESAPPASPTSGTAAATASGTSTANSIVRRVVRFSSATASVDVTIDQDHPAARDFLSKLPLTLTVEEFSGREKISYLPERLAHEGSPGSDPEDGDLIYFAPWGNLGFYYNASGIGYSDQTIHLGTYRASREQLTLLEGSQVTVQHVG